LCNLTRYAGWNWDYVFDWTILKYQRSNGVERPLTSATAALPAAGNGLQGQQQQQQLVDAKGARQDSAQAYKQYRSRA
jgi:hypothetical protein